MAAELRLYLTGGAGNTDPDASLGGVKSATEVSATALNNLFDDLEVQEAIDGNIEYRAIDLYNDGDATAAGVELWFSAQTASSDTDIAVGPDSGTQSIVSETTAPAAPAISFTAPTTGARLSISDIAAAGSQRLWLKRTCGALATNHNADLASITVRYA